MKAFVAVACAALGIGFLAGWLVRGGRGPATGTTQTGSQPTVESAAASPSAGTGAAGPGVAHAGPASEASPAGSRATTASGTATGGTPGGDEAARAEQLALAARQAARIVELEEQLRRAQETLKQSGDGKGPDGEYAGDSAAERRAAAARDGTLLVEFPLWGDAMGLSEETVAKHGLSAAEREALDRMYAGFYTSTMAELKRLYRELTGDPNAGEASSINALLHDVINLSPPGLCEERMKEALALLSAGQPLPPPEPGAPPCATVIYFLFGSVDRMEDEARRLGLAALQALWSGRSTFQFSGRPTGGDDS